MHLSVYPVPHFCIWYCLNQLSLSFFSCMFRTIKEDWSPCFNHTLKREEKALKVCDKTYITTREIPMNNYKNGDTTFSHFFCWLQPLLCSSSPSACLPPMQYHSVQESYSNPKWHPNSSFPLGGISTLGFLGSVISLKNYSFSFEV